jgi:hypothetical protein
MTATDEQLAAQLRAGHPETETYAPPPFDAVIARQPSAGRPHWRPWAAAAIAAAVVLAVGWFATLDRSSLILSPAGAPTMSVLTVIDLHEIALKAGVPDAAVMPLGDDTAVAVRWRSGRVELLRASYAGSWNLTVISFFDSPRPSGSASAVVANTTCIDPNTINGPSFIFGSLIENNETILRVHTPYVTDDAALVDGTFLFVIPSQPGETFWIDGPNDPGAPSPVALADGSRGERA